MQRYPASRVAPMSLLVPVVGITAAWLFLGEQPTYFELGGAALVIAGCAAGVLATPRSRARISPSPASSEPGTTPPPRAQLAASVSDVD